MDELLTENHRRVVGSGMVVIDSAIIHMLDLLEERSTEPAIGGVEGAIPGEVKRGIEARLHRLQDLIRALAERYQIEAPAKDLHRVLAAHISQIWVCLEDSRPVRIRGYGKMSAEAESSLEADLQTMLQVAGELRSLIDSF